MCVGCGNGPDSCHQYLFGGWLVKEAISLFDEKEPGKITKQDIIHCMQYKYNTQLSYACWHEIKMYDSFAGMSSLVVLAKVQWSMQKSY